MALATFARWGGATTDEARAAAVQAARLVEQGAGDIIYTSALQTSALLHLQAGDRGAAAREARAAVATDARNGTKLFLANDVFIAVDILRTDPESRPAAAMLRGALEGPVLGQYPYFFAGTWGTIPRDLGVPDLEVALGHEAYAAAYQVGAEMNYDEIIEFALSNLGRSIN
jgi:hypothetical protein